MDTWVAVLLGIAALTVSGVGGWPLTAAVLRLAARSSDAREPAPPHVAPSAASHVTSPVAAHEAAEGHDTAGPTGRHAREALRGGTWIGVLERLALTGSLLAGYPSGIAFVIAIKGLGRYPELKDNPDASERFVIGTLASMLWAALVGAVARTLLLGAG